MLPELERILKEILLEDNFQNETFITYSFEVYICIIDFKMAKEDGMLYPSLGGEVIFSVRHFIAPALDLMPIAIRASNSRREQSITAMKRKIPSPVLMCGMSLTA